MPLHSDAVPSSRTMARKICHAVRCCATDDTLGCDDDNAPDVPFLEDASGEMMVGRSWIMSFTRSIGATAVRAKAPAAAPAMASVAVRFAALSLRATSPPMWVGFGIWNEEFFAIRARDRALEQEDSIWGF